MAVETGSTLSTLRGVLVPLALAQFICSFAGSNMNVMINDMSEDLDTTVQGIQLAITVFLLVMAALMIPCGKLTDRYGRKRCFDVGLVVYAVGALMSAAAPGLGILILGNSILEGVGTALLIPPVYILCTLMFTGVTSRARAFGAINAAGRRGRRRGAAHRWSHHDGDQLARVLRLPGPGDRGDRARWVAASRTRRRRTRRAPSTPAVRSCPPPASSCSSSASWRPTTTSG